MTLTVERLELRGFRSYEQFTLEPDAELTVVEGPNAVGKTNLIEAIQFVCTAESFRKPAWAELVRWGSDTAAVTLHAADEERLIDLAVKVEAAGKRTHELNGKPKRKLSELAGVLPCVVFTPDDLSLVKDSAEKRRSALDSLGRQLSSTYARLKADYERALVQRNALLRAEQALGPQFETWTERLIQLGCALESHRTRLFERVAAQTVSAHEPIAPSVELTMSYVHSWAKAGVPSDEPEPMRAALTLMAAQERARRTTLVGPHRDDVLFTLGERDARSFGSQGQQRSIALAWKMAEVSVIEDVLKVRPLLLLDDVMSELDEKRRSALAATAGRTAQTIMTTANLGYFSDELVDRASVVSVR